MFETLLNSAAIDGAITALATAGVSPAAAIFGVLAVSAASLFAVNKLRDAARAVACDGAQGPAPKSQSRGEAIRTARNPLPTVLNNDKSEGAWSKAA